MNIETLRDLCISLPQTVEDIKWGNDLCFCVAEKMYCVTNLEGPFKASMKVEKEEFDALTEREGIIPAPYLARYFWILVQEPEALAHDEWINYVTGSYNQVVAKLPAKKKADLNLT